MAMNNRNIGAILCPKCGKLINANAEECIHCGFKNPGKKNLGSFFRNYFRKDFDVVKIITIICISFYVLSLILKPSALLKPGSIFDFLSPSMEMLYKLGMTGSYAMAQGRWWSLITAIYLHGNLLHILFNVLWIRQLGPAVEDLFGTSRFIVIFTVAGVLGFIVSNVLGVKFTIGASGSIFGLLGALIYYGRNRGGFFGEAIFRQFMAWAVILFLFGFMMSGVNNFAHAGGFAGGYLSAQFLGYNEKKLESDLDRNLAIASVIITIFSFVLVLFNL